MKRQEDDRGRIDNNRGMDDLVSIFLDAMKMYKNFLICYGPI
jgi:hypothetical protein